MVCLFLVRPLTGLAARNGGYDVTSGLWAKAILQPASGPVNLIWKEVGSDITPSGDKVVSGYFYADPGDFAYGSQYNPEVFVKIYITKSGWCNIAFNHVTVDNVSISSAHNYAGSPNQSGMAGLNSRLVEDQYDGVIIADESTIVVGTETWAHLEPGAAQNEIWLKKASSYVLTDLQGSWASHGLASAPGAPWWERATATIRSDGSFQASAVENDGYTGSISGTLQLASDGTITLNGQSNLRGNLDAGKTIVAITDTWEHGSPGTAEMKLWVKQQVSPYSLSELAGSWAVHGLASRLSSPFWIRGALEIQSNGSYQAALVEQDEQDNPPDIVSGKISITSDGIITRDDGGNFKGGINKGN